MIWNKFNTFGIRGCFPHHQHQVICFGFLLVLTPANWEELLRRLVRYIAHMETELDNIQKTIMSNA